MKNAPVFLLSLLFLCFTAFGQQISQRTLSGKVVDADTGEPISSVSIRTMDGSRGTASDAMGHFEMELSDLNTTDTLLVSHVGYKSYRLPLARLKDKGFAVRLTKEIIVLNEVTVYSKFWLKRYTPEQLNEDYKKFYSIMEKVHTGLFDYITEEEWSALKDSSQHLFEKSMTHSAFYQLIAWHVGKIRNMHTRHGVTDSWYKKKQDIFPFNVRYFGDRLYVTECFLDDRAFPKGTEILTINGKTPFEIKSIVWPFIPADGYSQTGRSAALNDYFPWYYSLFVEEAESYDIKLRMPSGEETDVISQGFHSSFSALSFSQVWKEKKPRSNFRLILR